MSRTVRRERHPHKKWHLEDYAPGSREYQREDAIFHTDGFRDERGVPRSYRNRLERKRRTQDKHAVLNARNNLDVVLETRRHDAAYTYF